MKRFIVALTISLGLLISMSGVATAHGNSPDINPSFFHREAHPPQGPPWAN